MKRIPIILILTIAAFVSVILIGFPLQRLSLKEEGQEITKVYYADHISPAHQAAIELFNARHRRRNIEVVPVDLPFDKFSTNERKELLTRSLRSKSDRLDVFTVDHIWVPRFAKWSEPLGMYLTEEEKEKLLSFAVKSCVYESTFVAAPLYIDIGLMYYRKDILHTLPDADAIERRLQTSITWDEMIGLQKRLGYQKKPFYVFQAKDYEGLVCNFFELAVGNDEHFFAGNDIRLGSKPAEKALQTLVNFVQTNVSPQSVVNFDENLSYRYMLDSDAVFVRGWPNFVENFRTFYRDTAKLSALCRAPLPHVKGKKPTSVFGGWNMMISKSSTKKKEAAEFIRFMQSEEVQRLMFERGGYIPILTSVYQDSAFLEKHTELKFYYQLLHQGFHRPALEEYTKTSDVISYFTHLALKQELSVSEALKRADEMIRSKAVLIK